MGKEKMAMNRAKITNRGLCTKALLVVNTLRLRTGTPIPIPRSLIPFFVLFSFFSCAAPNDPPGQKPAPPPPPLEIAIPYDLHPLRTAVPAGFIRGADISNCYEIEQYGGVYRNFDDQIEDIMKILTDNGINYARLRLWVDPDKHWGRHTPGDGDNNLAVTTAIAVRAKDWGMKFLLNFHYSDYWADPSHQHIPYDWKDIPAKEGLLDALYNYTKETIEELIEAGAEPDMVQIGNEISGGLLFEHAGYEGGGGYALNGWQDYSDALKIAARAVREAAPNAKIMVHIGEGGSGEIANIFANFTRRANGQAPAYAEVDYDVMGLSWYTFWPSHQSIDSLYSNIGSLKQTFGKDVVICETGYLWTIENFDNMGNYAGTPQEDSAGNLLTNANGFTLDSGVTFAYRPNGTTRYVPASPENQARVIRATMDAVAAAGGLGVMWWGADWIAPVQDLKSNAEMGTLFDNFGAALPAMKVLGGVRGADTAKPGLVTGLRAAATGDTVALTWDGVNGAIAAKYQLERREHMERAAASPPSSGDNWTSVSDNITGDSYSDTGLAENTAYYYRIRAYNKNGWGNYSEPVEITTAAFAAEAPTGLRVSGATDASVTLIWNAVVGAASYKLYGVKAPPAIAGESATAAAPADSAYAPLADTSAAAYTHGGLTAGNTWWYKVSAVYTRGEGPMSAAASFTVGAEVNFKSAINMSTAALDADFLDPLKAASSASYSPITKTDGSNYQIEGLYAANDAVYLYVALDYGAARPAMWRYDWITVWIDNANSETGGANTGGRFRIAQNQTLAVATIEASISQRQNTLSGTSAAKNATWTNVGDNLWAPAIGSTVIKYRIALADIGGAAKGHELRILAANTQGWNNGNDPRVGGLIPAGVVTGAGADAGTVTINMSNALSYTVK